MQSQWGVWRRSKAQQDSYKDLKKKCGIACEKQHNVICLFAASVADINTILF